MSVPGQRYRLLLGLAICVIALGIWISSWGDEQAGDALNLGGESSVSPDNSGRRGRATGSSLPETAGERAARAQQEAERLATSKSEAEAREAKLLRVRENVVDIASGAEEVAERVKTIIDDASVAAGSEPVISVAGKTEVELLWADGGFVRYPVELRWESGRADWSPGQPWLELPELPAPLLEAAVEYGGAKACEGQFVVKGPKLTLKLERQAGFHIRVVPPQGFVFPRGFSVAAIQDNELKRFAKSPLEMRWPRGESKWKAKQRFEALPGNDFCAFLPASPGVIVFDLNSRRSPGLMVQLIEDWERVGGVRHLTIDLPAPVREEMIGVRALSPTNEVLTEFDVNMRVDYEVLASDKRVKVSQEVSDEFDAQQDWRKNLRYRKSDGSQWLYIPQPEPGQDDPEKVRVAHLLITHVSFGRSEITHFVPSTSTEVTVRFGVPGGIRVHVPAMPTIDTTRLLTPRFFEREHAFYIYPMIPAEQSNENFDAALVAPGNFKVQLVRHLDGEFVQGSLAVSEADVVVVSGATTSVTLAPIALYTMELEVPDPEKVRDISLTYRRAGITQAGSVTVFKPASTLISLPHMPEGEYEIRVHQGLNEPAWTKSIVLTASQRFSLAQ